jgi:hypothetical protein
MLKQLLQNKRKLFFLLGAFIGIIAVLGRRAYIDFVIHKKPLFGTEEMPKKNEVNDSSTNLPQP